MQAPSSPSWTRGPSSRRRASYPDPGLRVSDADRAEAADRLSKHYSDGRLNEEEFNERLDKAMKAKTHADFGGLFADLPASEPPKAVAGQRPRRPFYRFAVLALIFVIAVAIAQSLTHLYVPWLLIAVLVFLWLRYSPRRYRRPPDD